MPTNLSTLPRSPAMPAQPSRWSSVQLLGNRREVQIEHRGETYTLRLTAAGKLILTK